MSVEELKDEKAEAVARRNELEKALGAKIGERDKIEEKKHEFRKEADKLEERTPESLEVEAKIERRLQRIDAELKELTHEWNRADERVEELRPKVERWAKRVRRLARRIRNAISPKVVDLHMAGGGGPMGPIKGSIGHYTAGPLATTDEQAVRLWWAVRAQHLAQQWSNIGYHIGLGPEGGIYLLRPMVYSGAHTLGYNTGYVGLSVHGTTGHKWTRPQLRALRKALRKYNLNGKQVWGHNDFNPTGCPGSFKNGYTSKGRNA